MPYAWSPIGKPWEVTAYSRGRRLNVLGFLGRAGKLVYHTTIGTVTTDTVIDAFDRFVVQKDPESFAVVVLDNASMHASLQGIQAQDSGLDVTSGASGLPVSLLTGAESDRDSVASDEIYLAALESLPLV